MRSLIRLAVAIVAAASLAGCASGPKYTEMKSSIPTLAADQGRVVFYRTTALGAAVQPEVRLNGVAVGSAVPKGFFWADRPAGSYEVSTSTEVERKLTFTLDKAQVRYVRLNISIGFFVGHIIPELVDNATGDKEIADLSYAAPKPAAK
jgi:outer membrane murein-binding lipoprotein Lpp